MMYGFAMAKPPRPTVKIGLAMASPYAIPIFCDENRQNKPRSRGFSRSDGWFTARRQVTYTLFLSHFAFLTTDTLLCVLFCPAFFIHHASSAGQSHDYPAPLQDLGQFATHGHNRQWRGHNRFYCNRHSHDRNRHAHVAD